MFARHYANHAEGLHLQNAPATAVSETGYYNVPMTKVEGI